MGTNSQSFRTPSAGTRRFGSPPSVDAQPPLKKQRIDASGALEGHDIALSMPERSAMNPSMGINTEEDPSPDVNPVSSATKFGSSASKHASGAANPKKKQKRKKNRVAHEAASPGDVLWHEVQRLIGIDVSKEIVEAHQDFASPFEFGDELVVDVLEVGAGGTFQVAYFAQSFMTHTENSKAMGWLWLPRHTHRGSSQFRSLFQGRRLE